MFIKYLAAITMAAMLSGVSLPAPAQGTYPSKPVRLIVPFPAGRSTDIVARLLADSLAKLWGQPVVVINQSGVPGTLAGRDAPADGYTLTFGTSARGPKEWTEFVSAEIVKWGEAAKRANLKAD